jgi:SAM-dependent methyltransferase
MIIHKLILQHLKARDDADFYNMQARDAISWIQRQGVQLNSGTKALDLGCGHGIFGGELLRAGCDITFADETNYLHKEFQGLPFIPVNLDSEGTGKLGQYDLVILSNVLEHLRFPEKFLNEAGTILKPKGYLYLSWTNWLSPWGGHEFSPFHYLGPNIGPRLFSSLTGKKRIHTPYQNLFPTYIGTVVKWLGRSSSLEIRAIAPRYYPELSFIPRVPLLREFLTWNCAILLQRSA